MYSFNRTTTSVAAKVRPSLNISKTTIKATSGSNENASNIPKPKNVIKPYRGTLTRSSSLKSKSVSKCYTEILCSFLNLL